MNTIIKTLSFVAIIILFAACDTEDPGPLQEGTRDFAILDFDELEMGSALNIRVEQGNTFLVRASGDRRNINDLEVFKSGNALVIKYDEDEDRKHQTYLTIQMPTLKKVNFSGGSVSVIEGFESDGRLDVVLSGGSVSQLDAGYRETNLIVSGGSVLKLHGLGDEFTADISGASNLNAYDFPVRTAKLGLSGGSVAKVTVSDALSVSASGASHVSYHGNPSLESELSGSSSVTKD